MSLLRVQNESRDNGGVDNPTTHFTLPPSILTAGLELDAEDEDDEADEDSAMGPNVSHAIDADFGQPQRPALAKETMENALDIINVWNWPTRGECDRNVKV